MQTTVNYLSKVEVGVSMLYLLSEPFSKVIETLAKTSIRHVELVDDGLHALDRRRALKLKEIGKSFSLRFSVHAPFADINIASPSNYILRAVMKRLEKSIGFAGLLEVDVWVFHPGLKTGVSMFYPGADWTRNCESARTLYKIAEDYGLRVAIENVPEPYPFLMKSVEHFEKFYNEVNEDIGLALDVGHANINGQIELFLKTFPNKIVHIHAHDNHGREDEHLGIGHGSINWEKFAQLLREIAYNKAVVIESVERIEESIRRLEALLT
jgi:sugar phosphate isomerase/epimerase